MDIAHHFIERGRGFPLLLLHGNGEDSGYFSGQIDAFSAEYHVFALDTRGHGKTPRGDAPFTIRQFADDLLGFMDARGISAAHILGFSDGANIAMIFAVRHPDRVGKLILNGGGVRRRTQLPIELGYRLARAFADKSPGAKANAELLGLMVNDPNIDPAELKQIRSPALVLAGTRDMIAEAHTRSIAESIPGAELRFLKGGHFIARKAPAEFNKIVLQFLKEDAP